MASSGRCIVLVVLALLVSSAVAAHHHSHGTKSPAPSPSPAAVEPPSVPPSSIAGPPAEAQGPAANGAVFASGFGVGVAGSMAVGVGIFAAVLIV